MDDQPQRSTSQELATGLRAFHQGTLHGLLCGVELTFTHLLWECGFWKGRVKDLPQEWQERLAAGTDPELWQRGFAQGIFCEPEEGQATMQGTGLWKELGPGWTKVTFAHPLAGTPQEVYFCHPRSLASVLLQPPRRGLVSMP